MMDDFSRTSFNKAEQPAPIEVSAVKVGSPEPEATSPGPTPTEAVDEPLNLDEPASSPIEKSFDSQVDPMPVVKVLSTRGVEYAMLTITLWLTAIAILWILLALVNGGAKFDILDVPLSITIICLPVFAYLFLRRKKAELADPKLKQEPSKRRWTQFSQILAFLATLANLITFVYLVIAHFARQVSYSVGKTILDELIILVIVGGILAYYWHDEHKLKIQ